jgi:hypothetical protein
MKLMRGYMKECSYETKHNNPTYRVGKDNTTTQVACWIKIPKPNC